MLQLTSFATACKDKTSSGARSISSRCNGDDTIRCLLPGVRISNGFPLAWLLVSPQALTLVNLVSIQTLMYASLITSAPSKRYAKLWSCLWINPYTPQINPTHPEMMFCACGLVNNAYARIMARDPQRINQNLRIPSRWSGLKLKGFPLPELQAWLLNKYKHAASIRTEHCEGVNT
jgi:hypothetical protein